MCFSADKITNCPDFRWADAAAATDEAGPAADPARDIPGLERRGTNPGSG
jgi:hypothetical protein